jgi:hypothetical protein
MMTAARSGLGWLIALGCAGCAPHLVASSMANPARTHDKLESAQEYDIGPYKENHRYAMTVKEWTPSSIGVEIKLADIGDCALPQSYSFTLVDDQGARHPFRATGEAKQTSEKGAGTATLTVSTLAGSFEVPIGPDAHAITIEQRPQPSVSCPALDFRWTFQ